MRAIGMWFGFSPVAMGLWQGGLQTPAFPNMWGQQWDSPQKRRRREEDPGQPEENPEGGQPPLHTTRHGNKKQIPESKSNKEQRPD